MNTGTTVELPVTCDQQTAGAPPHAGTRRKYSETLKHTIARGVMGCGIKKLWRCHQLLSTLLAHGYLLRVSRQACLSTNDKRDNEMIPGAVHKSPSIYLPIEENLW